jgi:hypothetical protein
MTTREGLLRVLSLIEHGWTKGRNRKRRYGRDCYCISGAIDEVAVDIKHRGAMADRLYDALPTHNFHSIVGLNICKVCFKLYDRQTAWQVLSHTHQGQGPEDKRR